MFCATFEKYLGEAATAPPRSASELGRKVEAARATLAELVDRALPDVALDAKLLRDTSFVYWDELARVGYDVAKVSDAAKTTYLQDSAHARGNLERFGTGTCGIVTTTTAPRTTTSAKRRAE